MKILFIVPYPTEGPSNRFRVEQYLDYLKKKNILYCLRPFYNSHVYRILHQRGSSIAKALYLLWFTLKRIADVIRAINYDIVFVHRESHPLGGAIFEFLFKAAAGRLIYDFDDSIFLSTDGNARGSAKFIGFFRRPSRVKKIISLSDHVIAGNNFLAEYAQRFNSNVTILPTCIDTAIYKPRAKSHESVNVVIGWIGSPWTAIYLSFLNDVFMRIVDRFDNAQIRIVGARNKELEHPRINYRDWTLSSEVEELQQFDIGIMPLSDDEWAKGKCAFKIIQYMSVGIPVVASSVGMNLDVINNNVNGLLVKTEDEWFQGLSHLIQDASLRSSMGQEGRIITQSKYSVTSNAEKLINILKKVLP